MKGPGYGRDRARDSRRVGFQAPVTEEMGKRHAYREDGETDVSSCSTVWVVLTCRVVVGRAENGTAGGREMGTACAGKKMEKSGMKGNK